VQGPGLARRIERITEARPVIATETLPAGLYRIAVRDAQGMMMGTTWVKE